MLQNFNAMLGHAYKNKYAIGSFNVYNYETMRGVVEAGKKMEKPVIVAFGAKYLTNMSLEDAHSMAETLSKGATVSICLHLDHCSSMDTIFQAMRAGFNSVMYDGSTLTFEENIKNTELVTRVAHSCGVSVEAELGSLAAGEQSHEGAASDRQVYTDPERAREFVQCTGVDALAVSVGTVHGLYKGTPNVRVDILKDINAAVGIPLVLHGGSGTPEETIRACITNGISKINVNTEISVYAVDKTAELLAEKRPHLSVISLQQQKFVSEVVKKYIRFFENQ